MNVMVAAGEVVSEFVNEQNGQQREGEGQAADEREWMFVKKGECVQEFVEVYGFVFGVGCGEVRAGYEAGAERYEEKKNREQQSFQRRMRGNDGVLRRSGNELKRLPVGLFGFDRDAWV